MLAVSNWLPRRDHQDRLRSVSASRPCVVCCQLLGDAVVKTLALKRFLDIGNDSTQRIGDLGFDLVDGPLGRSPLRSKATDDAFGLGCKCDLLAARDGHELTFQVNHLAPFLLTMLLRERLARSGARVIVTSSMAHTSRRANVDLDDLTFERSYRALDAYATTKLENVLFIRELARRWDPLGSRSAAVHPGMVRSRFGARSTLPVRTVMASPLRWIMRSPERGADTIVWLATSTPNIDWISGGYYADRAPARAHPRADDADLARELWERSAAMVGTMV